MSDKAEWEFIKKDTYTAEVRMGNYPPQVLRRTGHA